MVSTLHYVKGCTYKELTALTAFYSISVDKWASHWHFRNNFLSNWKSGLSNSHYMSSFIKFRQMGSSNQIIWLPECHMFWKVRNLPACIFNQSIVDKFDLNGQIYVTYGGNKKISHVQEVDFLSPCIHLPIWSLKHHWFKKAIF